MSEKNSSLFSLKNRIALVTGGCGNLGPYWMAALIEAGAKVAIIDLPNTKLPKSLIADEKNGVIKLYHGDITNLDNLAEIHREIKEKLGLVGILVNNAGIDVPPTKRHLKGGFAKMWHVNVQGLVNCIEEFYSDMKEKGYGSIVNIGSLYMERSPYEGLYTHLGFDKPWAYGATKAAVGQVTRHYATRLAKYGIRVNTLSPGGVFANQDKEFVKKYSTRVPQGRMANRETDLSGPLVFLVSEASCYVTGINLRVNGGYTSW